MNDESNLPSQSDHLGHWYAHRGRCYGCGAGTMCDMGQNLHNLAYVGRENRQVRRLRNQLHEIAIRWVNEPWARMISLPRMVNELAAMAFFENRPESADTRAIRRAHDLLEKSGFGIGDDAPAVD